MTEYLRLLQVHISNHNYSRSLLQKREFPIEPSITRRHLVDVRQLNVVGRSCWRQACKEYFALSFPENIIYIFNNLSNRKIMKSILLALSLSCLSYFSLTIDAKLAPTQSISLPSQDQLILDVTSAPNQQRIFVVSRNKSSGLSEGGIQLATLSTYPTLEIKSTTILSKVGGTSALKTATLSRNNDTLLAFITSKPSAFYVYQVGATSPMRLVCANQLPMIQEPSSLYLASNGRAYVTQQLPSALFMLDSSNCQLVKKTEFQKGLAESVVVGQSRVAVSMGSSKQILVLDDKSLQLVKSLNFTDYTASLITDGKSFWSGFGTGTAIKRVNFQGNVEQTIKDVGERPSLLSKSANGIFVAPLGGVPSVIFTSPSNGSKETLPLSGRRVLKTGSLSNSCIFIWTRPLSGLEGSDQLESICQAP